MLRKNKQYSHVLSFLFPKCTDSMYEPELSQLYKNVWCNKLYGTVITHDRNKLYTYNLKKTLEKNYSKGKVKIYWTTFLFTNFNFTQWLISQAHVTTPVLDNNVQRIT